MGEKESDMFGVGRKKQNGPLRLENVRFSSEDILALNNGYDNMLAVAKPEFFKMDDDRFRAKLAEWRRDVAMRMTGTGLVDSTGTPSDELARALLPLSEPGRAISNRNRYGTVTLYMCGDNWTLLKKDRGFMGGWGIYPVDASLGIDAVIAPAMGVRRGVRNSIWESHAYLTHAEATGIQDLCESGCESKLGSLASLRGVSEEALLDLCRLCRRSQIVWYPFYGFDNSDGVKFMGGGFKVPYVESGFRRRCAGLAVPEKGFFTRQVKAPLSTDEDDPFLLASDCKVVDERTYDECRFVREGDLFNAASAMPKFRPADAPAYK